MTPYQKFVQRWESCDRCALSNQRTNVVLARGSVPADIVIVGEAPGVSEDVLGQPFVGPAGKLLDQIVDRAMAGTQTDGTEGSSYNSMSWAFCNLVACFPRDAKATINHQPLPTEIKACEPRLKEFLALCKPKLVVCVGSLSAVWVRKMRVQLGLGDVKLIDIVHPAAF